MSKKLPPTAPGYRNASQSLPLQFYYIGFQDLFHPNNLFYLLPAVDIVGRPVVLTGNLLAGSILKGRGALSQECEIYNDVIHIILFLLLYRGTNSIHLVCIYTYL